MGNGMKLPPALIRLRQQRTILYYLGVLWKQHPEWSFARLLMQLQVGFRDDEAAEVVLKGLISKKE